MFFERQISFGTAFFNRPAYGTTEKKAQLTKKNTNLIVLPYPMEGKAYRRL